MVCKTGESILNHFRLTQGHLTSWIIAYSILRKLYFELFCEPSKIKPDYDIEPSYQKPIEITT